MPTNFMYRLMSANESMLHQQEVQEGLFVLRMLHGTDQQAQLNFDRQQARIDQRMAELEAEFHELAIIANQN